MAKMVSEFNVFSSIVICGMWLMGVVTLMSHFLSFFIICRVFIVVVLVLLVVWLVLDTSQRPEQLISFGGVCVFILLLFLLSAHRTAVSFALGPLTLLKDEQLLWRQLFRDKLACSVILHVISCLSCLVSSVETLDIICPCASVILRFS